MLSKLELTNFRNWSKLALDLPERLILVGPNGVGKTNILEAIYLLAVTRSWRTKNDRDFVAWDTEAARVVSADYEIAISREPYLKKIKINSIERKATEAIGKVVVVLFEPRSINLVFGPPAFRRRFLDILLAQINQDYVKALVELQIVLRQRNSLLKRVANNQSSPSEMKFWNLELIKIAETIWTARRDFFNYSANIFNQNYLNISGSDVARIEYQPSINPSQSYDQALEDHWSTDLDNGNTTIGPHRDDFDFLIYNKPAAEVASQGEARSLVLALKMTEISYLSENMGKDPILLLDDIFSELDSSRRSRIESLINHHQAILTATDLKYIDPNLQKTFTVLDITNLNKKAT